MSCYAMLLTNVGSTTVDQIEAVLPGGIEWARMNRDIWLLKGEYTSKNIYEAVKPALPTGSNILVIKVDVSERKGWVNNVIVEWLAERDKDDKVSD
jgi:hypothetical protein